MRRYCAWSPSQLDQLLHPIIDPKAKKNVIAKGLNASPGAAVGKAVFTADDAVDMGKKEKVILVRTETCPDDIHGMDAAVGILTARGGMTSHAAVVARGMGTPCVAGCESLRVDEKGGKFTAGAVTVKEGDWITIDGTTGEVMLGKMPTIEPALTGEFGVLMTWADKARTLKVRANADIPRDAKVAVQFGAEGIGLCRTEHMFFAEDRLPHVQAMILADNVADREKSLAELLPMQRADFLGLFQEMDGRPVTIRLLDPPLHEFLPKREELMVEIAVMKAQKKDASPRYKKLSKVLARVEELHEFNPMLGHRGCRLGIVYPEITRMQARAIFEAAAILAKKKIKVIPEVMVPLVGMLAEFTDQKKLIVEMADAVMKEQKVKIQYLVGTMIELPRAALTADEIAKEAEFFSFGTNDLTQTTFGFSRDDAGKFITKYMETGIMEKDPFVTIDQEGVGQLVRMGVEKGRSSRTHLKVGICGEHGGDPASVEFCHRIGLELRELLSVPRAYRQDGRRPCRDKRGGQNDGFGNQVTLLASGGLQRPPFFKPLLPFCKKVTPKTFVDFLLRFLLPTFLSRERKVERFLCLIKRRTKTYMSIALDLAAMGRGRTSPNPMVGAVIVKDGKIVGKGWHKKAGTPHAEAVALTKAGADAEGGTLYVNLEPCCHLDKLTPPCTDAILKAA